MPLRNQRSMMERKIPEFLGKSKIKNCLLPVETQEEAKKLEKC